MGNQIAKKVIAFLEEACEKEVRTLLGEQRESRNLWNFLLLNEDQKKVIDRIKPRIPKRLLKFAVGPLFEGYADNSELQLYFSLATGVDIKNASRDSLKSIDEQILETKHTFTMFFLRLWSHKFAKKDTSSTIDDKKDILKSSILAQLRNLTTQASSDWESELLVELLGVFLTQATDKMVKGDLCSLVEGLCNAIAKYSNRDSTESTPSDLVVRNQIDKFVRLLGDLYLSADKEDQKTATMNRLCQIATGTKNLKGRLALLKSLMSSADISTLKVKDLSDLSENKPISRDLITFNKELMTEIPFSDCFQNLPFDGIKTVLHLGLFLIDQKGLLIYKKVANFIEWDRLTSSIHIKSKIDIPANRAISSATLKSGEMILLLLF
jgi:hypothetical protein